MPPSQIIDSDSLGGIVYALEGTALWKAIGTGGGAATWTKILEAASYTSEIGQNVQFSRVRAVGAMLYVVAGTVPNGASVGDAYFFRSRNAGLTWNYTLIATTAFVIKPYKVDVHAFHQEFNDFDLHELEPVVHQRFDGTEIKNPWAVARTFDHYLRTYNTANWGPQDYEVKCGWWPLPSESLNIIPDVSETTLGDQVGPRVVMNNSLTSQERTLCFSYLDDYFGVGGYDYLYLTSMPKETARIYTGFRGNAYGNFHLFTEEEEQAILPMVYAGVSYVLFRYPTPILPIALDASKTNPDWVYVGSDDVIYKSEDGGYTWVALLEDEGAYDIHVDPQLGGVIYAWRPSGKLDQIVAGVVNATLDTETALRKPLRIARSHNNGKLWALKSGAALRLRNLAAWSDQQTGLNQATGLHVSPGDKLIFVDAGNIYTSDNGGQTVSPKKGDWATFTDGVNAHRFV